MRFRACFPMLAACAVLTGAGPVLAANKTPPPANTKLSIEENTKIIEDAKIGPYYDLHERRTAYQGKSVAFRDAMDNRRASYASPMIEARGEKTVTEQTGKAAPPDDVAPASGDTSSGLDEAGIRAFYAESATIHHKPLDVYKEWTKNHLHETFSYTQTMAVKLPGASPVVSSQTLTRKKMIELLDENYKSTRGVTMKNEVTAITIAPDGKSAEVKDKSVITGMSVPVGDGKDLRGDGTSTCNDKVVSNPGMGIQLLSSVCTVDVTLSASQDL